MSKATVTQLVHNFIVLFKKKKKKKIKSLNPLSLIIMELLEISSFIFSNSFTSKFNIERLNLN